MCICRCYICNICKIIIIQSEKTKDTTFYNKHPHLAEIEFYFNQFGTCGNLCLMMTFYCKHQSFTGMKEREKNKQPEPGLPDTEACITKLNSQSLIKSWCFVLKSVCGKIPPFSNTEINGELLEENTRD